MKFDDALNQLEDKRMRCKAGAWLRTLDPETRQQILDSTLPANTVWKALVVMGFTGSNHTWAKHHNGHCGCAR